MTGEENSVITRSVMLQTLSVPCCCRCRYCLLSWDGRTVGAPYERSEAFAKRFYDWIVEKRPDLKFDFAFGYSMEHPELLRALDFLNSIGSVGGRFLQFDGMKLRSGEELEELLSSLASHGVEALNFTFYGTRDYHDRFAARQGDFDYMLNALRLAVEAGLSVSAGMPLNHENAAQAGALVDTLRECGAATRLFVPHSEGRGASLEPIRFSSADLAALDENVKPLLNTGIYRTERDWLSAEEGELPQEKNRALIISLTPENIAELEQMPFERTIAAAEKLDEAYYAAFPPFAELAVRYGDERGEKFYRYRDLFHVYRRKYAAENRIEVYDVTDERQTGSRRY